MDINEQYKISSQKYREDAEYYANNFIETMSMIAKDAVVKAGYDKTIQGTIISCQDQALGKYKVKYQDSIWIAYSNNLQIKYGNGVAVYILIPGNDTSRNKTILGTVSSLGADYIEYVNNDNQFFDNGIGIINNDEKFLNGIKIKFSNESRTYNVNDYVQIIYNYNNQLYSTTKFYGTSIANKEVFIPALSFYLYWHTNATQSNYYGYSISSVIKATEKQNVQDSIIQNLPMDQSEIIHLEVGSYPESLHGDYNNNVDELYYCRTGFSYDDQIQNEKGEFQLCSYNPKEVVLYNADSNTSLLSIDTAAAAAYLQGSKNIRLEADFRTILPLEQCKQGNYGIIVTLQFENEENPIKPIERVYILDIDKMVGNPYLFITTVTQKSHFPIDGEHFKRVKMISIFCENFEHTDPSIHNNDIFISNIQITGQNTLSLDEQQGLSLRFNLKEGYIFTSQDNNSSTRTVTAQVRVNGKLLTTESNKIQFYWFKQNATVQAGNPHYSKYGGKGWYCLNQIIEDENSYAKFVDGTEQLVISKSDIPIKLINYKCVAIYNHIEVTNTFKIINMDAQYDISLKEANGKELVFFSNEDTLCLQCVVKQNQTVITSGLTYDWRVVTEAGSTQILNNFSEEDAFNKINISANNIRNYNDYYCTVTYGTTLIGVTTSIRIFKRTADQAKYVLSINNSHQLFNYDQSGNSPVSEIVDNPITIPELTFQIIDTETGQEVSETVDMCKWTFPLENTMLKSLMDQGELSQDQSEEYYVNTRVFNYTIIDRYSINKRNNTIKLQVKIHNVSLVAETDFIFTKQGEPGTNGTGLICKISAYDTDSNKVNGWLITNITTTQTLYNWSILVPELWRDGEKINLTYLSEDSIVWEMLSENDLTWYSVAKSTNVNDPVGTAIVSYDTSITPSINWSTAVGYPGNIVKLTILYEGRKYYSTIPIVTIYNTSNYFLSLDQPCGYKYVVYSQDGENPKYDDTYPFSIDTDCPYSITWQGVGSIRTKQFASSMYKKLVYLFQIQDNSLNYFQRIFKPSSTFDGCCVNNAIVVSCRTNLFMHIPIHFMLNRYGHKNLNDWDGNSISIDNNGNYILSPQIGAGHKDNDTNLFTGMLMGDVINLYDGGKIETGLFGYSAGERVLFLDSKTGRSTFGRVGQGQIILDPQDGAIIEGGTYTESNGTDAGTGMQINLAEPYIKFGSGTFQVDAQGELTCSKGKIGPWNITSTAIYYSDTAMSLPISLGTSSSDDSYIYLGLSGFSLGSKLIYNANQGSLHLNLNSFSIGGMDGDTKYSQANGNNLFSTSAMTLQNTTVVEGWTKNHKTWVGCFRPSSSSAYAKIDIYSLNLFTDNTYTLSFKFAKKITSNYQNGTNTNYLRNIYIGGNNLNVSKFTINNVDYLTNFNSSNISLTNDTTSHPVQMTFTINNSSSTSTALYIYFNRSQTSPVLIELSSIMLQTGVIVSAWQTSTADLNSDFQVVDEEIKQAKKTATSYLYYQQGGNNNGLYISETAYTSSTNLASRQGANIRITSGGLYLCQGTNAYITLDTNGLIITNGTIKLGTLTAVNDYNNSHSGFYVDDSGNLLVGKNSTYLQWYNGTLTLKGEIIATAGSIGDFSISSSSDSHNWSSSWASSTHYFPNSFYCQFKSSVPLPYGTQWQDWDCRCEAGIAGWDSGWNSNQTDSKPDAPVFYIKQRIARNSPNSGTFDNLSSSGSDLAYWLRCKTHDYSFLVSKRGYITTHQLNVYGNYYTGGGELYNMRYISIRGPINNQSSSTTLFHVQNDTSHAEGSGYTIAGQRIFEIRADKKIYVSLQSSGNASAVGQATDGSLCYQPPSSKRYKDIMSSEVDVSGFYNLTAKMAKYKKGFLSENDLWEDKIMPMLIAEEVDEICPCAAIYNKEGQVQDWNYRVLIPVHQQMLVDQYNEIIQLKQKIMQQEQLIKQWIKKEK